MSAYGLEPPNRCPDCGAEYSEDTYFCPECTDRYVAEGHSQRDVERGNLDP